MPMNAYSCPRLHIHANECLFMPKVAYIHAKDKCEHIIFETLVIIFFLMTHSPYLMHYASACACLKT